MLENTYNCDPINDTPLKNMNVIMGHTTLAQFLEEMHGLMW